VIGTADLSCQLFFQRDAEHGIDWRRTAGLTLFGCWHYGGACDARAGAAVVCTARARVVCITRDNVCDPLPPLLPWTARPLIDRATAAASPGPCKALYLMYDRAFGTSPTLRTAALKMAADVYVHSPLLLVPSFYAITGAAKGQTPAQIAEQVARVRWWWLGDASS